MDYSPKYLAALLRKEDGDDLHAISTFLGHSNPSITQIYLHKIENRQDASWIKFESLLSLLKILVLIIPIIYTEILVILSDNSWEITRKLLVHYYQFNSFELTKVINEILFNRRNKIIYILF